MNKYTLQDMTKVGVIGVDAGMCWIGDPCYIFHKDKKEMKELEKNIGKNWGEFCFNASRNSQFNYPLGHAGLGVCVSTGYGDGTYDVYAKMEDNTVLGIYIDFEGLNDVDETEED